MLTRKGLAAGRLLVLALAVSGTLAGCGGGSAGTDGVATAERAGGPSARASSSPGGDGLSDQERQLKFAQCMREHGVDMPDPEFEGGGFSVNIPKGTDRNKVDAAMQQCKQYMPNGGERPKVDPQTLEQLRQLAKCMREHGVPDFPDPSENGGIMIRVSPGSGLDPEDPKFKAAQQACAQYRPDRQDGGGTQTRRDG